jgi:branched-chain amino acid transport system substrate-binding protein
MKKTMIGVIGTIFILTSSMAFAQEVIKIGASVSMTGAQSRFGNMVKNGYELWKDAVNEKGGINVGATKYKVAITYYDDQSDPQVSAKLTEKLITEEKVQFLLGPYSSGITLATSAIAEKYNMINMACTANADSVYTRGYKNVFSILPPASVILHSFLEMLNTFSPVPQKLAVIYPTDLFPQNVAEGARDYAKKMNLDVAFFENYPKGAKDLSSLLLKVKATKPDVLIGTGYLDDAILAVRQSKDQRIDFKATVFTTGPELEDFTKNLAKDADYVYGVSWWMPEMNYKGPVFDSTQGYAALFAKRFGPGLTYQAAAASQGGLLLQLAIEKAKSLDMDKVREALRSYEGTTFWGQTKFDENGRNTMGKSVTFQIQKGVIKTVFPKEAAQTTPQFPQPAWSAR